MKLRKLTMSLLIILGASNAATAAGVPDELIKGYEAESGQTADAARGEAFWHQDNNGKSCASCHGTDLAQSGQHVKTKRTIDPMSPSVNPQRLTDPKKIEKWFFRNCKWTLGRECTSIEKADVLAWLSKQ